MAQNTKKLSAIPIINNGSIRSDGILYFVQMAGSQYETYGLELSELFLGTKNISEFNFNNGTFVLVNNQIGINTIPSTYTFDVDGSTRLDGTVLITGDSEIDGNIVGKSNLSVDYNGSFGRNLSVTGNTSIGGTLTSNGSFLTNGSATVKGNFVANGSATITGTLGVGGNVSIHGETELLDNLSVTGNTTITGTLTTDNDVHINNDLFVTGNSTISGPLSITGNTSLSGNLSVTGNTSINILKSGNTNVLETYSELLNIVFPVGHIISTLSPTNPATTYGIGTWSLWGSGRVPVCINTADTRFDTVGKTGGEYEHTLTVAEMPRHNHPINAGSNTNNSGKDTSDENFSSTSGGDKSTGYTGGDQAHNNIQPYIVCYMWVRTA